MKELAVVVLFPDCAVISVHSTLKEAEESVELSMKENPYSWDGLYACLLTDLVIDPIRTIKDDTKMSRERKEVVE